MFYLLNIVKSIIKIGLDKFKNKNFQIKFLAHYNF